MLVERGIWPWPWKGDGEVTVEGRRRSTRETKDCYERRDKGKEKKKKKYIRKDKKIRTK